MPLMTPLVEKPWVNLPSAAPMNSMMTVKGPACGEGAAETMAVKSARAEIVKAFMVALISRLGWWK